MDHFPPPSGVAAFAKPTAPVSHGLVEHAFGDLFVGFSVRFPAFLSPRSRDLLAIALQPDGGDSDDDGDGDDADSAAAAHRHVWAATTPNELHDLELAHRGRGGGIPVGAQECRMQ